MINEESTNVSQRIFIIILINKKVMPSIYYFLYFSLYQQEHISTNILHYYTLRNYFRSVYQREIFLVNSC